MAIGNLTELLESEDELTRFTTAKVCCDCALAVTVLTVAWRQVH